MDKQERLYLALTNSRKREKEESLWPYSTNASQTRRPRTPLRLAEYELLTRLRVFLEAEVPRPSI
jgi:hypothetical protein